MSETQTPEEVQAADEWLRETFSWYPVAKKEFKDTIRSRGLLVLSAVFIGFFLVPVAAQLLGMNLVAQGAREFGTELLLSALYLNIVTIFVPIVAIFVGYAAVTGERTSGSLKLLLSLPFSRRDVIVGKVLGRSAVLGVPLLASLGLTALLLALSEVTFKPGLFGLFVLYTTGFSVVMVALAVSISGASPSNKISAAANVVVYLYFTFFWNTLVNSVGDLLEQYLAVTGALRWHLVLILKLLNPSQAYKTLTNSMLSGDSGGPMGARFGMFSQGRSEMELICTDVLQGNASTVPGLFGNVTVCEPEAGGLPIYFSDGAVFVSLLLWIAVAAAISAYTFDRYDL